MADGRGDQPEPDAVVERARRGVRGWVAQAGRRSAAGVRAATPYGILAFLAASAVAPVAGAGLGASGEVAAALGQIGGMGGNYLTDVLVDTARRIRRVDGEPSTEQWRDALAAALEPLLSGEDERARELREQVGAVLRAVDAVGVALAESARATTDIRHELAHAVGVLGGGSEQLRWMLGDALRALGELQGQLAAHGGEQRQQIDLVRQSLVAIAELRRDVLAGRQGAPAAVAGEPPPAAEVACPYPGLASFQPEDAAWFCGREELVARVLGRLAEQVAGAGPLVLVGVSGVGKSSLLRAGVLPALEAGTDGSAMPYDTGAWPWLLFTPGDRPFTELVSRTAVLAGVPALDAVRVVRAAPEDFGALSRQAALAAGDRTGRLLVVVDQFEEVFTQCADADERAAFVTALTNAGAAVVVLAVRADFYADCARLPQLAGLLAAGQLVVGPMSGDEIRRAVTEPARRAGLRVEPGLVELVLADLGMDAAGGYDPGALPLLAHALRAAWQHRAGATVTVEAYRRSGGIRHAIAETAERIYLDLDTEGRDRLREALLRLVVITEGRAVVRRRAGREGLDARLLARLVAARLVTAGQDSVEISHEALLSNWPRLAGWLAESRSAILLRQRLDEAAQAWSDAGEDPDLLYRGAQLAAAAEWAASRSDLSPLEQRFVRAGTAAAEAAETDRARATRRLRRLVAGLAGTLVLVLVATAVAVWQAREVGRREVAARSRQYAAQALATGVDGQRARRLALQAWQSGHTREARGALASAQMTNLVGRLGSAVGGTTVAVGPDGTRVAVGHGDGTLQLWDATTLRPIGRRTPTGLSRQVVSAGFSSDGRLLATGTLPGTVAEADRGTVVWDAASGERLRQVPGVGFVGWRAGHLLSVYLDSRASSFAVGEWDPRTGRRVSSIVLHTLLPPYGLAVSPDAALVAVPGSDGVTRVWRLADGKLVATTGTPRPEAPTDAVFAADGSLVTSDTDGSLRVWAMPSGRPLRRLFSHEERGTSRLTATTDGVVYAAGSGDTIESWYVPGGEPVTNRLIGFTGTIQRVAVSADGALTVATGTDGVTTVWRRGDWLSHDRAVLDARFDPTGRLLATGDAGGTLRIWDSRTGTLVASHHYPGAVRALDYAPDGTLAVGVADGTVHLRDARGQDRTVLTLGGSLAPGDVRFSPDGTLLATGASTGAGADDHGVVVVWDVPGGRERERLDTGAEEPFGLTFSTHGDLLIAATTQQTLRPDRTYRKQSIIHTWRTSDLGVVGSYTAGQEQVTAIAAGPDGHTLAVAGTSNQVQFRSISDGHLTGAPLQHGSAVRVVTYAPDGRTLATATTADPTIRLWDTRTGGLLAELSGHLSGANSLAFSPDGRMLASGDPDQTVGLWHIEPADAVDRLCRQLRTVTLAGAAQPEACR